MLMKQLAENNRRYIIKRYCVKVYTAIMEIWRKRTIRKEEKVSEYILIIIIMITILWQIFPYYH